MIGISKELQALYATDGVTKTLKIYVVGTDTILSNDEISSESFTLTEILSDEEQITYGLCNASKVEFTTIGDNTISEGTVLKIVIIAGDSSVELPLGTYIVDSAKKQTNKQLKNIIAYDRLYTIDSTDMIYFYDKTVFPLTLKQLRDNFFNYVGITCEDTTLLNDNLTVNQNNDFRDLSAREFLTQICELNAVFGKMSRNDTFIFFDIVENSSTIKTDATNTFIFSCDSSFSLSLPPLSADSSTTGIIDWGDNTTSDYIYGYNNHSYENGGNYTVIYNITDFKSTTGGFCANNSYIKEAYLSEGIETISAGTFYCASNLESVHIPSTAKVDNMSFTDCTNLNSVIFGNLNNPSIIDLTQNDTMAFSGCTNLDSITYYTNDTSLINTSNSTYFQKSDTEYITVNYVLAKKSQNITFNGYPIRTVETENFETKKINRIKVIESGGVVLYNIGLGNDEPNYYNIKDNFLLTGRTGDDETLQNTIDILYTKINSLFYVPCTITAKGLPYLETGDLLQITKDNQTIRTYILSRTLKGTIALTDTYTANGVNTLREVYSTEESISQNVYNNYQSNRLNYITSQNGEKIILPTERTNAVSQTFGNTDDLSNFEYMAVITATIEIGGNIQFEYRVDGETLDIKPIQSAYSPTEISAYGLEENSTNVTYQQIVLYLPQTNSAIGTHSFEVDVISNATGYIDRNHWVSCWKGQNLTTTDKAVVSITIIDLPNKLKYTLNEVLDSTGLVVVANYLGGGRKVLTSSEYKISADTSTIGTQPVLITYKENPKLTATFNIKVVKPTEYLKTYSDGTKYLERYTTQTANANVYWVHEVDGVMTETYLSTSELASWECNTLEPHYYSDGSRQYVGYYQLPPQERFGEHVMRITYQSPDTGKILELKYSIYYLEEVSFTLDFESYDWYPFRTPLEFIQLGTGTLVFKCTKNDGKILTETFNYAVSGNDMDLTISTVVDGAEYKFGDNQELNIEYISTYAHKIYNNIVSLNIRKYNDHRNPEKLGDFKVNSLELFEITYSMETDVYDCISNQAYYSGNFNTFSRVFEEDAHDGKYYYTLPDSGVKVNNFQEALSYSLAKDLKQHSLSGVFKPPFIYSSFGFGKTCTKGESKSVSHCDPTVGFIYWGDGTFDKYAPAIEYKTHTNLANNRFFEMPKNHSGSNTSYYSCYYLNLLKPCGYVLDGNSRRKNGSQKMFKELEHQYFGGYVYTIVITSSLYGSSTCYHMQNNMMNSSGQKVYDFDLEEPGDATYKWEWYGNSKHAAGGLYSGKPLIFADNKLVSNRLAYDDLAYCIKGVSVGDGCLLDERGGYDYETNKFTTSVEFPAEGFNHLGLCLHDFSNLSYLRLPKYSGEYLGNHSYSGLSGYGVSNYSAMNNYDNLTSLQEIYFGGTIDMWKNAWFNTSKEKYAIDIYRQMAAVHDVPFLYNVGNNYSYRNTFADYILTIHCTDGDIDISLNSDCILS